MKTLQLALAFMFGAVTSALAQPVSRPMLDQRGYIDVFALRHAVSRLEPLLPTSDLERCETAACRTAALRESTTFDHAQAAFMRAWGPALLAAIDKGDEVAEVIWRQCHTTAVIERAALASTCDPDPVRRKEAAERLRQIGFEAAFDTQAEEDSAGRATQDQRRALSQARTLSQMAAGVYGGLSNDVHHGGNSPHSPEELSDIRRAAVLYAASTLVRRSFTYIRSQGAYANENHALLRLNRQAVGTSSLAWSANVFNSGSPYTGPYDPAWNGFDVYLNYDKGRVVKVGGKSDAHYLRMLADTLTRSEKRIDDWLERDRRWSVFLLHRKGHHEWIPEGIESPFGQLRPEWNGAWLREKQFINFEPVADLPEAQLSILTGDAQSIAQFKEAGASYACELRYSGGSSHRPEDGSHAKTATSTALGYLPSLAPISPHDAGPAAPFAPMNPHYAYRQVLVQCPQGEWPDNRNKRFLFLAKDTLIEVRQRETGDDLAISQWRRAPALARAAEFAPLARPFELRPTLLRLTQDATAAESADALRAKLHAEVDVMNADQLIASLAHLQLEKLYYSSKVDFPSNLTRLVATPHIATRICKAYDEHPPNALQRFNFMVVLNMRSRHESFTADELAVVPDCLRRALSDESAWVRVEAMDAFGPFAEERDRAKIMELINDPSDAVRMPSRNALLRLPTVKASN